MKLRPIYALKLRIYIIYEHTNYLLPNCSYMYIGDQLYLARHNLFYFINVAFFIRWFLYIFKIFNIFGARYSTCTCTCASIVNDICFCYDHVFSLAFKTTFLIKYEFENNLSNILMYEKVYRQPYKKLEHTDMIYVISSMLLICWIQDLGTFFNKYWVMMNFFLKRLSDDDLLIIYIGFLTQLV